MILEQDPIQDPVWEPRPTFPGIVRWVWSIDINGGVVNKIAQ